MKVKIYNNFNPQDLVKNNEYYIKSNHDAPIDFFKIKVEKLF